MFEQKIDIEIVTEMAEQNKQPRALSNYARPRGTQSSIVQPRVQANNFELKPQFVKMVQQLATFNGLAYEVPNSHLENFLEVCTY